MISVLGLWQIFVQLGHKRKQRYTNAFHNWEVKLHVFRRRRKRYVKQSRHWVTVIGWMIRDIFWIFLCECLSRRIYACAGSIIIEWKLNPKRSGNLKDLNKMFGLNLTQRETEAQKNLVHTSILSIYMSSDVNVGLDQLIRSLLLTKIWQTWNVKSHKAVTLNFVLRLTLFLMNLVGKNAP